MRIKEALRLVVEAAEIGMYHGGVMVDYKELQEAIELCKGLVDDRPTG